MRGAIALFVAVVFGLAALLQPLGADDVEAKAVHRTPSPTPAATATRSATSTPTSTPLASPTTTTAPPSATSTLTPTATNTATSTATRTATATQTTPPTATATAAPLTNWRYTALGDSLADGLWAFFGGYVSRYRSYSQTDTGATITLSNLGVSGWTSTQLLAALTDPVDSSYRDSVRASAEVTWNIGGNDFLDARDLYKGSGCGGTDNQDCLRQTVATFKSNWTAIMNAILAQRSTANTMVRTMDLYNPYVDDDRAADTWASDGGKNDFEVFKPYFDDINAFIAQSAQARGVPVARVSVVFNGADGATDPSTKGYISFDGLHPNDAGHKAMADALRALRYAPLR
jgi:lysophospholipase L1-like esterase